MEIRTLLFSAPLADSETPLFRTQLDLAQALIEVSGGGFERKSPENVRIFVNQVLKAPNEPRSRPASPNFRRALAEAIRSRVRDSDHASAVAQRVLDALDRFKAQAVSPANDDEELGALWSATTNPDFKEVVVITPTPAETLEDEFSFATRLTDALISRVIIKDEDELWDPDASYDFFILNETNAHGMRSSLINRISRYYKKTIEEAELLVTEAMSDERLNIYHLVYDDYLPPMCIFEPNSNKIEGYELFYISPDKNKVSVGVKDKDDLQFWKSTFHKKMYVDLQYEARPTRGTIALIDRKRIAYLRRDEIAETKHA